MLPAEPWSELLVMARCAGKLALALAYLLRPSAKVPTVNGTAFLDQSAFEARVFAASCLVCTSSAAAGAHAGACLLRLPCFLSVSLHTAAALSARHRTNSSLCRAFVCSFCGGRDFERGHLVAAHPGPHGLPQLSAVSSVPICSCLLALIRFRSPLFTDLCGGVAAPMARRTRCRWACKGWLCRRSRCRSESSRSSPCAA